MALIVGPQAGTRKPGLLESFGIGIGEGLESLAQNRLQNILQAQKQEQEVQKQEQQNIQNRLLESKINEMFATPAQATQIEGSPDVAQMLGGPPQATGLEAVQGAQGEAPQEEGVQPQAQTGLSPTEQQQQQGAPEQEAEPVLPIYAEDKKKLREGLAQVKREEKELPVLDQASMFKVAQMRLKKEEIANKQRNDFRKESIARQEKIDAETKDYYQEVTKKAAAAKVNLRRLKKLKMLTKYGRLGSPFWRRVANTVKHGFWGVGFDVASLIKTPDAEEFEKTVADMASGIIESFTGKVTNAMIDVWKKKIPSLLQTREGNMRLITSLELQADADILKKKSMTEVIKENRGRRPADIDVLVSERIGEVTDLLYKEFLETKPISFKDGKAIVDFARYIKQIY